MQNFCCRVSNNDGSVSQGGANFWKCEARISNWGLKQSEIGRIVKVVVKKRNNIRDNAREAVNAVRGRIERDYVVLSRRKFMKRCLAVWQIVDRGRFFILGP